MIALLASSYQDQQQLGASIETLLNIYVSSMIGGALFWLLIYKPYQLLRLYWIDRRYERSHRRYLAMSPEEKEIHTQKVMEGWREAREWASGDNRRAAALAVAAGPVGTPVDAALEPCDALLRLRDLAGEPEHRDDER